MAYDKTDVSVSKSQEQIRRLIYGHKGSGLMLISKPPKEGFEALVELEKTSYHIRVMATCRNQLLDRNGFKRSPTSLFSATQQEERRVWRVLYWHLKAMFEAADAGVIDIRDVVMPYVVLKDGRTLAEHLKPRMPELMTAEPERLLSGGG